MDYIVKSLRNNLTSFYYEDENIYCKIYKDNNFCNEKLIAKNVFEHYSVCIAHDSSIYLFCQSKNGDILLCHKSNENIDVKIILQNTIDSIQKVKFTALISKKELTLIYNTKTHLLMQQLDENGKWKKAETIDTYVNFPNTAYITQNTSVEHLVLFYLTPQNHLAYREINTETYSNLNTFYSLEHSVIDTSFLLKRDSLHMVCIIKNTFSYQLLYRRKDSLGFKNIKILWDSHKIEKCLIFESQNTIYISFAMNGQLYIFKSQDNGESFSDMMQYKEWFAVYIKKAIFISESTDSGILTSGVYISDFDPSNISLFPEVHKTFD